MFIYKSYEFLHTLFKTQPNFLQILQKMYKIIYIYNNNNNKIMYFFMFFLK